MALLESDPHRIGRPSGLSHDDHVAPAFLGGTPEPLKSELIALLGAEQVEHRAIDLVRYASDASPYRLVPQVVVVPRDVDDMVRVLSYCRESGRHATFRAAGTSLSGQAQSDDVLVDVRRHFTGMVVEDEAQALRARPGTVLSHANAVLKPHGRRLGPDPASAAVATVGGVVANNSGGMRCTVQRDAYQTVRSMTIVLASGTVVDTAAPDAELRFAAAEPELAQGLLDMRAELLADADLAARIRSKFTIRNTTGYRLVALLDAETPLEIFRRLMVGSEGTLGFMAEVVIDTLPAPATTTVAWLPLPSLDEAVALVPALVALGAEAVELMVGPALMAAAYSFPGTPEYWKTLDPDTAALLVEFGAATAAELDAAEAAVFRLLEGVPVVHPVEFTREEEAVELAWRVREGLLGIIGKMRAPGTAMVIEDVCFPPARLAEAAHDLQALLGKHGFIPGVAGHAAYGNLHFTLTPVLADEADKARYDRFMSEFVDLVLNKYDGSLKAEHGTGLNMAPFVRLEWGDKATDMMWRVKQLADPHGVLAPNVLLSDIAGLHLRSFKSTPEIEEVATHCIECGFCEPVCPSRNVTMTPRQRIVVRREMARQPKGSSLLAQLQDEYGYDGIDTCAADGTCAIPCPVSIDTGILIKGFRAQESTDRGEKVALRLAQRWATVEELTRRGLAAIDVVSGTVGERALAGLTGALRKIVSTDLVPAIVGPMPRPAPSTLPPTQREGAAAVYFPACINRIFGRAPGVDGPSLPAALVTVSARAGRPLWIPEDVQGLCCSTPWGSKGYRQGQEFMAAAIADALWRWTDHGALPVVVDASSCTHGLLEDVAAHLDAGRQECFAQLTIHDAVTWAHEELLPRLTVTHRLGSVALHPTCSTTHLGLNRKLAELAAAVAEEVVVPLGTTCCGTAGDRGLLHPELVVSATEQERETLDARPFDAYLSANRTCEMGLHQATGRPYESFVLTLEEATRV